ncbi:unnamed protein product [Phytophthora fragariaefolia]|uniref:Unnamed protein product n=1 Tax=Phytophthora fragariaefolia TaxID=1490495 RepID=A0A9W6XUY1_9STRA|nr:unnamed protein product [Phytophthora fragariaefolia]
MWSVFSRSGAFTGCASSYVGLLKPYQDPSRVRLEDLGSRASATRLEGEPSSQRAVPRGRSQDSDLVGPLADRPAGQSDHDSSPIAPEEFGPSPAAGAASQSHRNNDSHADERPGRELGAHSNSERTQSPRSTSPEASAAARRPPPALLDEQGNHHYHMERILARRRCRGQNQYLVKWRGYSHSENSWEFEVPLRQDCPDVVDAFDQLDQQLPEGSRPPRRSFRAFRQ